jgi:hypothetical protein
MQDQNRMIRDDVSDVPIVLHFRQDFAVIVLGPYLT